MLLVILGSAALHRWDPGGKLDGPISAFPTMLLARWSTHEPCHLEAFPSNSYLVHSSPFSFPPISPFVVVLALQDRLLYHLLPAMNEHLGRALIADHQLIEHVWGRP